MFLIEEKGISGGIYHSIHQYAGVNSKQKDCNLNKESSYLMYWDVSNLYGWTMSHRLSVDSFEMVAKTSKWYRLFFKVDAKYPRQLHTIHNDFPFLPERTKLKNNIKLVGNLYNTN